MSDVDARVDVMITGGRGATNGTFFKIFKMGIRGPGPFNLVSIDQMLQYSVC